MNPACLFFFEGHLGAIPIYEALEDQILAQVPAVKIKVGKSQIGFSNRRGFAYASFNPCRPGRERPENWLTVTFGLGYRHPSPRIDVATEPYPGRWTHHVMVGSPEEVDEELMGWIREAAAFSESKR